MIGFLMALVTAMIDASQTYTMSPMVFVIVQGMFFLLDIFLFAMGKILGMLRRADFIAALTAAKDNREKRSRIIAQIQAINIFNVHCFDNALANAFIFAWSVSYMSLYYALFGFPILESTAANSSAVDEVVTWTLYRAMLFGMLVTGLNSVREFVTLFFGHWIGFSMDDALHCINTSATSATAAAVIASNGLGRRPAMNGTSGLLRKRTAVPR